MSKISYISGSLHKISDQLSEAATKKEANPEEETSVNFPAETVATPPGKTLTEIEESNGKLKARYDELFRLKRDVIFRVTEHAVLYASEADAIGKRKAELDEAEKSLNALLKTLEECEMPDLSSEIFKSKLANALRLFENARLEDIRTAARMEGAAGTISRTGTAQTTEQASFAALTGGELFKKGFVFFLPLILTLLFAALLLSAAFFAAWKIAF